MDIKIEQLRYIPIVVILILIGCSKHIDYRLDKNFKSIVDNKNCKIDFYYPNLVLENPTLSLDEVNKILEHSVDYEYYAQRCNEANEDKRIITGDFNVILKTDTLISIEYQTIIINYFGNKMDTIYHSLVLNPKKIGENRLSCFYEDLSLIFPNFDRGVLYKFVDKFNREKNKNVNLLAYQSGSNYVITWGITETHLVLYLGGEGEAFGYDKIKIPIDKLR